MMVLSKPFINDESLDKVQRELVKTLLQEFNNAAERTLNAQRYMNKQQTCKYLQISNNTLDCWIKRGLPFVSVGSVRRFDRQAIDKWLTASV